MSTNNKTQSETIGNSGSHTGFSWQNGFTDTIRDLMGLQMRTAQFVLDKSLGFGQAMSDLYQNQMNETVKLTQEYAKYGWGLTETLKKTAYDATDRTMRGFNG